MQKDEKEASIVDFSIFCINYERVQKDEKEPFLNVVFTQLELKFVTIYVDMPVQFCFFLVKIISHRATEFWWLYYTRKTKDLKIQ